MGETLTVDPLMTRITDTLNKAELPSKRSEAIALGVALRQATPAWVRMRHADEMAVAA